MLGRHGWRNIMKKVFLLALVVISFNLIFAQDTITVLETKLEPRGEQVFMYSFTCGDKIVIDFNGYLDEVSVLTQSGRVYGDRKQEEIKKVINVQKEEVYAFCFDTKRKLTKGKEHNLRILRVPSSDDTYGFNTGVETKIVYDTTYTHYTEDSLVGHETVYYTETVKEIVDTQTNELELVNKEIIVHAHGTFSDYNPREYVEINIPSFADTETQSRKITSWAYFLGVNENGSALDKIKGTAKTTTNAVSQVGGVFSKSTALGAFAAGSVIDFIPTPTDVVSYWLTNSQSEAIAYKNGTFYPNNSPKDYCVTRRVVDPNYISGTQYICLYNSNTLRKITVRVQAVALVETTTYKYVDYQREKVVPQFVKVNKVRTDVTSRKVYVVAKQDPQKMQMAKQQLEASRQQQMNQQTQFQLQNNEQQSQQQQDLNTNEGFANSSFSSKNSSSELKVGQLYIFSDGTKGVIFHIGPQGNGLVVSLDQAKLKWDNNDNLKNCQDIKKIDNENEFMPFCVIGQGLNNTKAVREQLGQRQNPAVNWCMLHGDGWYLPSAGELNDLLTIANDSKGKSGPLSESLIKAGGMGIENEKYWSSTEKSAKEVHTISAKGKTESEDKDEYYFVRAVRVFETSK